jgi:hypothetical protein
VGIEHLDEGDAPPISRDRGDQSASEPHDSTVAPETRDRNTYEADLRRAVDAEHGTAREPQDAAPGTWHADGDRSLNPEANADREAYLAQYRVLVEAEYRDARRSWDGDRPALRQARADHEKTLLHADADPLRAFGSAFETHPAEFQMAMASSMPQELKSTCGPIPCPTHPAP